MHAELRRKGVTLKLVWLEYREAHPDGYGYSQFCDRYGRWAVRLTPRLRVHHTAGEKCVVDDAGPTIPVVDAETGVIQQASIFVGVLGASSYTYAEAQFGQTLAHWIGGHLRMFSKVSLLILDDWLRDPLSPVRVRDLLEILDDRYGRSATMIVAQLPIADWHRRIADPTIADALLDRLVHNAHRLELKGESQRKKRSPLAQRDQVTI